MSPQQLSLPPTPLRSATCRDEVILEKGDQIVPLLAGQPRFLTIFPVFLSVLNKSQFLERFFQKIRTIWSPYSRGARGCPGAAPPPPPRAKSSSEDMASPLLSLGCRLLPGPGRTACATDLGRERSRDTPPWQHREVERMGHWSGGTPSQWPDLSELARLYQGEKAFKKNTHLAHKGFG